MSILSSIGQTKNMVLEWSRRAERLDNTLFRRALLLEAVNPSIRRHSPSSRMDNTDEENGVVKPIRKTAESSDVLYYWNRKIAERIPRTRETVEDGK
jgi:hypothetical protein